jgi:hypothetical protein|tara:strand:- start:481 stop:627 length:147 start_codon:yes stop_codon:yes gene_type:complete
LLEKQACQWVELMISLGAIGIRALTRRSSDAELELRTEHVALDAPEKL